MVKWLMTVVLAISTLGLGTCFVPSLGCAATPKTPEQMLALMNTAADIAHKHGVSYLVEAEWGGDPGVSYTNKVTIHSDIKFRFQMYGNAGIAQANQGSFRSDFEQVDKIVDWVIANSDMVHELGILALPSVDEETSTMTEGDVFNGLSVIVSESENSP